jgi:subtilisin-like proprotein convertase family protein
VNQDIELEFRLTVSDGELSSSDYVKVLVKDVPEPTSGTLEITSSDTPIEISKKKIKSIINISKEAKITGLKVHVKVKHKKAKYLKVSLRAPYKQYNTILKHSYSGKMEDIDETYTVNKWYWKNKSPAGEWKLLVTPSYPARKTTGTLESWTLFIDWTTEE